MTVIVRNGWLEGRDVMGNRFAAKIAAIEVVREMKEGESGVEILLTSHSVALEEYYHEVVEAIERPANQGHGRD